MDLIRYLGALMRRSLLLLLVGALAWPTAAQAQIPAPTPEQPEPPGAPGLVLSGRNIRLTRTGVIGVKLGCRTSPVPNEACIGSLTVRLADAITITAPPPGRPNARPVRQTIRPFNFGVIDFTIVEGDAAQVRLRLNKRAQDLIRRQQSVRVDLIASYNSRAGADGSARRNVRVYFPTRPGS